MIVAMESLYRVTSHVPAINKYSLFTNPDSRFILPNLYRESDVRHLVDLA